MKAMALATACAGLLLLQGGSTALALSDDVSMGIEISDALLPSYPIPGEELELRVELTAHEAGSGLLRLKCLGGIDLVAEDDTLTAFTMQAGEVRSYAFSCEFVGGTGSRVDISLAVAQASGVPVGKAWRSLSIVPRADSGTTAAPRIGLYFEQQGDSNCTGGTIDYPALLAAHLVVTNAGGVGTIVGWEAALAWTDSLLLSLQGIAGAGSNYMLFPDFNVAVPGGVPGEDTRLLASFNVVALGSGSLSLAGPGVSDPDGRPVLAVEGVASLLRPAYAFGSPGSAVAVVGDLPCPVVGEEGLYVVCDSAHPDTLPYLAKDARRDQHGAAPPAAVAKTQRTYDVHVSGAARYEIPGYSRAFGVSGVRVYFWFENPITHARWHPVSGFEEHVHYDTCDMNGNYQFNFTFVGDLASYNYTQIAVYVGTQNEAVHMPTPNDGSWYGPGNGLLNITSGVLIPIDSPEDEVISVIHANANVRSDYASILRHSLMARDCVKSVYGGTIPFPLPWTWAYATEPDGEDNSGSYDWPTGAIRILPSIAYNPTTVVHEYAHYLMHRMWDFTMSGALMTNGEVVTQFKEGWAIFFTFAARNYARRQYSDNVFFSPDYKDAEVAPFLSPRYDNLSHRDAPSNGAFGCYLWNLYDDASDNNIESIEYLGDNDDISGYKQRVFEALRTMDRLPADLLGVKYHEAFKAGLGDDVAQSVDRVRAFMYDDLYAIPASVRMRAVQASGLRIEMQHARHGVLVWDVEGYDDLAAYRNAADAYRVYRMVDGDWVSMASVPEWSREYELVGQDVAGEYRVVAEKALAGESCMASSAMCTVVSVGDRGELGRGIRSINPNPGNPSVTIAYGLERPSRVRLSVYDIRGRLIRLLLDEPQGAGLRQVRWDGSTDAGVQVGSGMYFCRMEAGSFRETRRMTLVK